MQYMFTNRQEAKNLEPLDEAKKLFRAVLKQHITEYEERLKKPFFVRLQERIKTEYGEKGYKRTKDFLEKMDGDSISRTEDLINLTNKYTEGRNLPLLLEAATVKICSFTDEHIALVKRDLREEIIHDGVLRRHPVAMEIALDNLKAQSINFIYNKIMTSHDYGEKYLSEISARCSYNSFKNQK